MNNILTYGLGDFAKRGHIVLFGFGELPISIIQINFSLSIQQNSLFALER